MSEWLSIVIGLMGLGSIVLAALRWRRDDTAALVTTQSTVLHDIESINTELKLKLEDCEKRKRARAG